MSDYLIEGGYPLNGEVEISGSKNAALGIIAASMVLDGPCILEHLPQIVDVRILLDICSDFGAKITYIEENTVEIDPSYAYKHESTNELTKRIRASYYLLGALLSKFKEVKLAMPGGCDFGTRPINLHLEGFRSMGAKDELIDGIIHLNAKDNFKAGYLYMDKESVGATINVMIAATKAPGITTIENAAKEPHIVDVANFLNLMGAKIRGAGTDTIRVKGVTNIPGKKRYSIIPDQIEAGTFMIAAAITKGDVTIKHIIPKHMESLSLKMRQMGIHVEEKEDAIKVSCKKDQIIRSAHFKTMPYPGFPTDLQPQAMILLCMAKGLGKMHEAVWQNRFQYISELRKMNTNINVAGNFAFVEGPQKLQSAVVQARDLRAGAAMILASLVANGTSRVTNIQVVERGYQNLVEKLRNLGAHISIVDSL